MDGMKGQKTREGPEEFGSSEMRFETRMRLGQKQEDEWDRRRWEIRGFLMIA